MPLTLAQPESISVTVVDYRITAFSVDIDRGEIHVSYDRVDGAGNPVSEHMITLMGPDFQSTILDANTIAGADVYAAIKGSLYNQIIAKTGVSGTLS